MAGATESNLKGPSSLYLEPEIGDSAARLESRALVSYKEEETRQGEPTQTDRSCSLARLQVQGLLLPKNMAVIDPNHGP